MKKFLLALVLMVPIMVLVGCNNENKSRDYGREYEIADSIKDAVEDSIKRARHDYVNDSMSKISNPPLLGDIYLGMPKRDFDRSIKALKDAGLGEIEYGGLTYEIGYGYVDRGVLYSLSINKRYFTENIISSKLENCEFDRRDERMVKSAYETLCAKYGLPNEVSGHEKNCYAHPEKITEAKWKFDKRNIVLTNECTNVSEYGGKTIMDYRLTIEYIHPQMEDSLLRVRHIADSIRMAERDSIAKERNKKNAEITKGL